MIDDVERFHYKQVSQQLAKAIQQHIENGNTELALQKTYELQRNLAVLSELERRVNDGDFITST